MGCMGHLDRNCLELAFAAGPQQQLGPASPQPLSQMFGMGTSNPPNLATPPLVVHRYGEKLVKGSPNPRSYYKCSHQGCLAKKIVERNEEGEIITTEYKVPRAGKGCGDGVGSCTISVRLGTMWTCRHGVAAAGQQPPLHLKTIIGATQKPVLFLWMQGDHCHPAPSSVKASRYRPKQLPRPPVSLWT